VTIILLSTGNMLYREMGGRSGAQKVPAQIKPNEKRASRFTVHLFVKINSIEVKCGAGCGKLKVTDHLRI
jgi:hypothetical protein